MDGVGSRLGRASSRYGPATTVFNGPVRKWKKKWVHVSPPSSTTVGTCRSSRFNGHGGGRNSNNNENSSSRLLLCKWTPLSTNSSSTAGDGNESSGAEEPPRRRIRYTPIVVVEEKKIAAEKKVEDTDADVNKLDINKQDSNNETQKDPKTRNFDLEFCLNGEEEDSVSQNDEDEPKATSSGAKGFWKMG